MVVCGVCVCVCADKCVFVPACVGAVSVYLNHVLLLLAALVSLSSDFSSELSNKICQTCQTAA